MKIKDFYRYRLILDSGEIIEQKKSTNNFKFNNDNPKFKKVRYIHLIPESENVKEFLVKIPDKARLIYFKRTVCHMGKITFKFNLYLVGWQTTVKRFDKAGSSFDVNIKQISYLYPDGTIENSGDETELVNIKIKQIEDEIVRNLN